MTRLSLPRAVPSHSNRTVHCASRHTLLLALVLSAATAGAAEGTGRCDRSVPDIYDVASPAVVMISAQSINPYRLQDRVKQVLGSGFLIDERGLVVTNSHVVYGMQAIEVTLDDGTVVQGKLLGADPIFDVAVVQIPQPDSGHLPILRFGDSDGVRPGEEVIAIGNPLGLGQTVTRGIVSGLDRRLPETPLSLQEPLIQTDTPINPGNSGGPLVDRCGDVIGVNTSMVSDAQSIGFAIPSNLVKALVPALVKDGRVIRPWVGFHGQLIGAELRQLLRLPLVDGLLVEAVEPGSPAEKAGIRGGRIELTVGGSSYLLGGDIVVSLNGVAMTGEKALEQAMRGLKVGAKVALHLFQDGKYRDVEYTLPERPVLPGDIPQEGTDASSAFPSGSASRIRARH